MKKKGPIVNPFLEGNPINKYMNKRCRPWMDPEGGERGGGGGGGGERQRVQTTTEKSHKYSVS